MEKMKIPVTAAGRTFEIELCSRTIDFEDTAIAPVEYYWMDTRGLRAGGPATRNCTDLWWACMAEEDLTSDRDDRTRDERLQIYSNHLHLSLALLYPLVGRAKSAQKLIRNAMPRRRDRQDEDSRYSLDPAEVERLCALARTRSVAAVGNEIRKTLVGDLPPEELRAQLRTKFYAWMEEACEVLRSDGRQDMEKFLEEELLTRIQNYRRRGDAKAGSGCNRKFINMVVCETRVAFNTCFHNAWVLLVPWLRKHRGLSPMSERLLELMHTQNPNDNGNDVFWGQILSQHPSSAWLLDVPDHRAVLGRYLASVAAQKVGTAIDNASNPAYWELVGSTLIAFREYVGQLAMEAVARRISGETRCPSVAGVRRDESQVNDDEEFYEDYAEKTGLRCKACRSRDLTFKGREIYDASNGQLGITYRCGDCGEETVDILSFNDTGLPSWEERWRKGRSRREGARCADAKV